MTQFEIAYQHYRTGPVRGGRVTSDVAQSRIVVSVPEIGREEMTPLATRDAGALPRKIGELRVHEGRIMSPTRDDRHPDGGTAEHCLALRIGRELRRAGVPSVHGAWGLSVGVDGHEAEDLIRKAAESLFLVQGCVFGPAPEPCIAADGKPVWRGAEVFVAPFDRRPVARLRVCADPGEEDSPHVAMFRLDQAGSALEWLSRRFPRGDRFVWADDLDSALASELLVHRPDVLQWSADHEAARMAEQVARSSPGWDSWPREALEWYGIRDRLRDADGRPALARHSAAAALKVHAGRFVREDAARRATSERLREVAGARPGEEVEGTLADPELAAWTPPASGYLDGDEPGDRSREWVLWESGELVRLRSAELFRKKRPDRGAVVLPAIGYEAAADAARRFAHQRGLRADVRCGRRAGPGCSTSLSVWGMRTTKRTLLARTAPFMPAAPAELGVRRAWLSALSEPVPLAEALREFAEALAATEPADLLRYARASGVGEDLASSLSAGLHDICRVWTDAAACADPGIWPEAVPLTL